MTRDRNASADAPTRETRSEGETAPVGEPPKQAAEDPEIRKDQLTGAQWEQRMAVIAEAMDMPQPKARAEGEPEPPPPTPDELDRTWRVNARREKTGGSPLGPDEAPTADEQLWLLGELPPEPTQLPADEQKRQDERREEQRRRDDDAREAQERSQRSAAG